MTTVTAAGGGISITGTGGSDGTNFSDFNAGVRIAAGAQLIETGTGAVDITGSAGNGELRNRGVNILGTDTLVAAGEGGIAITGTGGSNGTGGSMFGAGARVAGGAAVRTTSSGDIEIDGTGAAGEDVNVGVVISTGSMVTALGTGNIDIDGTGGFGDDDNTGVDIDDFGTIVSATTGNITIDGTGGTGFGDNDDNEGVEIDGGAIVETTGTGMDVGNITITGTGRGADDNEGVQIQNLGTFVRTVDGDIMITGSSTGFGNDNVGVDIELGAVVRTTGTGDNAGNITIKGLGSGSNSSEGVQIEDTFTTVSVVDGDIMVIGRTEAFGDGNEGVEIQDGASVASFGTGTGAGTITIDGIGSGMNDSEGVQIAGGGAADGIVNGDFETGDFTGWTVTNILATGRWSINDGTTNTFGSPLLPVPVIDGNFDAVGEPSGVSIQTLTQSITLPTSINGSVLLWQDRILNAAGVFVDPNQEFRVLLDGVEVFSTDPGDPSIQFGPNNRFFDITALAQSLAGQTVDLQFVQVAGINFLNTAVDNILLGVISNTEVTSVDGDIIILGDSNASGDDNEGVDINDGARVTSTGTGANAADITIQGFTGVCDEGGGEGGGADPSIPVNDSEAVLITGTGTTVGAVDGDIDILGITNSTGMDNAAVEVSDSGAVAATGDGTIDIAGLDNNSNFGDPGVLIDGADSMVSSDTGDITITAAALNDFVVPDEAEVAGNLQMDNAGQILSNEADIRLNSTNDVQLGIVNADADGAGNAGTVFVVADAMATFNVPLSSNTGGGGSSWVCLDPAMTETVDIAPDGFGAIVDNLATEAANISGAAASLDAADGIGSGVHTIDLTTGRADTTDDNDIDTSVSTLAASNGSNIDVINGHDNDGDINVENQGGGLLTIGTVGTTVGVQNEGTGDRDPNTPGGDVSILNNSPLEINADVTNNNGGNVIVSAAAPGDLGINANVMVNNGSGDIMLNGGTDVDFGPGNTIQTDISIVNNADNIIDVNAVNGDVTGDFVTLGSTTTIRTGDGIAIFGKPFIGPITVPQIDILGNTSLTAQIGVAGETNILVTINWGDEDPTVPFQVRLGNADDPTDVTSNTYVVDAGVHTFFHLYLANPSPNPADPIPIQITAEHDDSIAVDGFSPQNLREFDYTIRDEFDEATTPGTGFGATVFVLNSNAPAISFPETSTATGLDSLTETSVTEEVSSGDRVVAGESTAADDEKLVLRLTLPSGDTKDFPLPNDILEGDNVKLLWKRLTDGRYQIVLIREDGTERVVLTVEVRGGRAIIRDNTPDAQQNPNPDGTSQETEKENDAGKGEQENGEAAANEMSRVDEQALPLPATEEASATLPVGDDAEVPADRVETAKDEENSAETSERRPAVSAAALVGSAIAYRSLRRGSSANGSWEELVEEALASDETRSLGRAARLRRQLLR